MDKIFRLSLKKRESFLPAQFVQLLKPVQSSPIDRCKVKQTGNLICHLYETCPVEESIFKSILKPKWEIVPAYCCQLLRGTISLKPESNPFHTYTVVQQCKIRQIIPWPLIKPFIRDTLERCKENSMTSLGFYD